ncbi:MAG TPA: hypothetical protein VGB89_00850 [Bacteroidota bacterium]|jgi:hypothetical protein
MKLRTLAGIFLGLSLVYGCGEGKKEEPPKENTEIELKETEPTSPRKEEPVLPETLATTQEEMAPANEPAKPTSKAKPAKEKGATVIGEVVDLVSYATSGVTAKTAEGKEIMMASIQGGNPLGILERGTGEVYIVTMKQASTSANATLQQYIGIDIAAKGDVYRKGGQQLLVLSVIGKSIK